MKIPLYIFIDEGGNFDFSPKGSRYFSLTCVSTARPFHFAKAIESYRYDCIEFGLDQEYFHCTDDNSHVRRRVFQIISEHLDDLIIDSIVTDKTKAQKEWQDTKHFYARTLGIRLASIIHEVDFNAVNEVIVITDTIPLKEKRNAIEKVIKLTLARMLGDTKYRIIHHASKAHIGLQIADYCNWAIYRKYERGDERFIEPIASSIRSIYDNEF